MSEDLRIRNLTDVFGQADRLPSVRVGIGDDAAVVGELGGVLTVLTVDTHVEDVHFRRSWLSFRDLGYRSFMAAASDVAAMGAVPTFALSSLILPADLTDDELSQLAHGQADAARDLGAVVVGGNLARGPLSITTTVLGRLEPHQGASGALAAPLPRSGAKEGDLLLLGGPVGLAAAGLAALMNNVQNAHDEISAWRRPRARVDLGLALVAGGARACIDISDGLALDLHRLCEASGVGAEVRADALLASSPTLREASARVGVAPLELALHGGEDYALLATSPHEVPGFAVIGRITSSDSGLSLASAGGAREPLARRGFQHF